MLIFFSVVYFVHFFKVATCDLSTNGPSVVLPLGVVEGFMTKTVNGRDIFAFEGVPFAQSPVGDLRFEKPFPLKPWKGKWQAKTLFRCMQYDHYTPPSPEKVLGDEDCLYVNVYSPNIDPNAKLDVLVYIHGGAFMFNHGGQTHPDILLDREIIFVNLNYRLGPLGFLSTEDEVVPGNNGMRDQSAALKWIKNNIQYFGGNPDSITISGMSAGGASVHTHLLTHHSKGLFSKAISQSGVILNPWVIMESPLNKTKVISSAVGCPTNDNREMITCLKSKPGRQIVHAVKHFQPWRYNPFSPFGLVVDKWAPDPIFSEHPYKLLKKGLVQDIPWMTTYTSAEGLYPGSEFYFDEHLKYIDENWNDVMPYILHYNDVIPVEKMDQVSSKIRNEYFQDDPVTKQTFQKLIQIISDRLFIVDIELASRLHVQSIKSPAYSYFFNYRGAHSRSEARTKSVENIGVAHGDDTAFVFKMFDVLSTEDDRAMSKLMVDTFVSFMKTGKPNITSEWLPLSKKMSDPWIQLRIDGPYKVYLEKKEHMGNSNFWRNLPLRENQKLFDQKDEL